MSTFTPAGSGGVPISTTPVGLINPTIVDINILVANTEQSVVLPVDATRFLIQVLSLGTLKVAFGAGLSGTNYMELPKGCFLSEDDIGTNPLTLYVQSPVTGVVARVESWTSS